MYNNLNKVEFLEFFEEELQKALVRAKKEPSPENILREIVLWRGP